MPTPLSDLALASAADIFATAEFVDVLARQHRVPHHTSQIAGLGRWLLAIRERSERKALDAADGAKADVTGHPFADEITALIDLVTGYTKNLPATRTSAIYASISPTPFVPGGGAASARKLVAR